MKKSLLFIFLFLILISTVTVKASTETASQYILMDLSTGRILEGKDYNNPKLIASITNIMTT